MTEAGVTTASYLSTLNIDEPLVRQTSSGNEYYHTDDLGSTVALSDDTGSVTTRYTYGPFGVTAITGSSTNPFQFTGRENDGTGLYYYRARYYSPVRSRFLSEDPLAFDGGDLNLYAYVFNNPANFTDPTGESIRSAAAKCVLGMAKTMAKIAGLNLALPKPDINPASLLDAAQGCVGGGNKPKGSPPIKPGSSNGPTAGQRFPQSVIDAAKKENPTNTCVYCRMEGTASQTDHAIPRARGGDATIDNAQRACPHCNQSKGQGNFLKTPPPGYRGPWPPAHW